MKVLQKIITNPVIILLLMIKDLIDMFKSVLLTGINQNINFDWTNFAFNLLIAVVLWLILKSYFKQKFEMQVLNSIMKIRLKNSYLQMLDGPEEDLKSMFSGYLISERMEVLEYLQKKFPDKSRRNLESIINKFYFTK